MEPRITNGTHRGETGSRWLASMAAEAGGRIHRGASRGGNFAGGSRRTRRSKPLSFCARLHAILRRASASLPYGPPNGSRQEPVAEAGTLSDANRRPDWLSRNEFVYEGISQIHRAYADRISPSPRELKSDAKPDPTLYGIFVWNRKNWYRPGERLAPSQQHRSHRWASLR